MKIDRPIISIIITFFNEELYLERCLQSVVSQSYSDFEVLLIDDGSTDDSLVVAKKFSNLLLNAKIISIENVGHAEARNIGLQNCTGTYVTFLDADDTLAPKMMEECIESIQERNSDILICDFHIFSDDGKIEMQSKWHSSYSTISNTAEMANYFYQGKVVETVWAKVFLTEIAKKITFTKGLWFDDRPFLIEFLLLSKSVTFLPKKLVNTYCRKSSITRRVLTEKRIHDVFYLFEVELALIKKYQVESHYRSGVFKNTLDYFMDTYLIQIIDENEIAQIKPLRNYYLKLLSDFKKAIKQEKINFSSKDRLALVVVALPHFVGWNISNRIIYYLKYNRLCAIKKIKNQ